MACVHGACLLYCDTHLDIIHYILYLYGCDIWAMNNIQTFCVYTDDSHNIIDNLVPLESLILHVRMDNDSLYDMGLH